MPLPLTQNGIAQKPATLPIALPGFEHVVRTWNATYKVFTARLLPGEYYVSRNNEGVYTTLGSCVSACIRDRVTGVGGMNHFMLPTSGDIGSIKKSGVTEVTRYGYYAMEYLINTILTNGGKRENLEVKIFGGGRIIASLNDVGKRNIQFALDYLETENLNIVAEDLGDVFPRMVVYFPKTGIALVKRLRNLHNNTIVEQESRYIKTVESQSAQGGEVEFL